MGHSINDEIDGGLYTGTAGYTSFDAAVAKIRRLGQGKLLAQCVIKSAFMLVPVHPDDSVLLDFALD